MKNIKTVKSKDTKIATKTPAAVRTPKTSVKRTPALAAKAVVATAVPVPTPRLEITKELIAARAYILWEKQGKPHGHDVANWLLAESQLKQEILTARN